MGDNILNYRPTGDEEGIWEASTLLHFDPFVSSATLTELDVECPKCDKRVTTCKSSLAFSNTVGQDRLYEKFDLFQCL